MAPPLPSQPLFKHQNVGVHRALTARRVGSMRRGFIHVREGRNSSRVILEPSAPKKNTVLCKKACGISRTANKARCLSWRDRSTRKFVTRQKRPKGVINLTQGWVAPRERMAPPALEPFPVWHRPLQRPYSIPALVSPISACCVVDEFQLAVEFASTEASRFATPGRL